MIYVLLHVSYMLCDLWRINVGTVSTSYIKSLGAFEHFAKDKLMML